MTRLPGRRSRGPGTSGRVRVYHHVRTAHLERARKMVPAAILYGSRRYDFDPSQVGDLDLAPTGVAATAGEVLRRRVGVLEVNEPLMLHGLPRTVAAVLAARIGSRLRRRPLTIVTFAIGNVLEWERPAPRWRSRVRRSAERALSFWLAARLDRIVYGTSTAQQLYRDTYGDRLQDAEQELLLALPQACDCALLPEDPDRVLFVGSFVERKGVPQLLQAWPLVRRADPAARLTLVGTGRLAERVEGAASVDDTIEVIPDPPREQVHEQLRRARVLVLLSQPAPQWREQLGLPLLEALAHGTHVVTTTESGLADWLSEHGHTVLDPGADAPTVAAAVVDALRHGRPASCVLADLPERDGRLVADERLMRPPGRP